MYWSVSKVDTFTKCPYQYKLRYLDRFDTLDDYNADDPLKCGTALHETIEIGPAKAIANYLASYPVVTDEIITQTVAIETLGTRAKAMLPTGEYEHKIAFCGFTGFIDLLVRRTGKKADIYDFKFCGQTSRKKYIEESAQLHAYKYYLESIEDVEIEHLFYVFVPKPALNQYPEEDIIDYRWRLKEHCLNAKIDIVEVGYEPAKVGRLVEQRKKMENTKDFPKNQSALCNWCAYQDYCYKGESWMLLPKAERTKNNDNRRYLKLWLYGAPYSGKTYMADKFPMPLQLNTDGNIRQTTAPVVTIRDEVTMHGKAKTVKMAWEVFKEAIEELEKGSEYKTIVVDLVEDVYESCRLYMYDKLDITHESDDSFRAWDKVRIEFLSTMRKLTTLDYNIVLISQEDMTKDITKKSGDKMSTVTPALQDKIAKKISGMVDVTARCVHDEKGYKIVFNTDETQFGGCRMSVETSVIDATIENLFKACGVSMESEPAQMPKEVKQKMEKEPEVVESAYASVDMDDDGEAEKPAVVKVLESKVVESPEANSELIRPVTRRVRRAKTEE